jgi:hypothetical protein
MGIVELDRTPCNGAPRRRLGERQMTAVIFIVTWLAGSVASVTLMIAHMRRTVDQRKAGRHRGDSEVERARAHVAAEIEEHDIDDMLDAIGEYRRRAGRRDIGEELADELLRSTWQD